MKLRIPRETAKSAIQEATALLIRCGFARRWEWCGSYRRGLPTVGDLDLAVWASYSAERERADFRERVQEAVRRVVGPDAQTDVRFVHGHDAPYAYPAMVLYLTGPAVWNVWCRARVHRQGCLLNEYGLWYRVPDHLAASMARASVATTERTLLRDAQLPPISPRQRDRWRTWKESRGGSAPSTGLRPDPARGTAEPMQEAGPERA